MEYRLIRDLLRHYDHRIRPSLNASEPLNVTFGLALAQIIDVVRIAPRRPRHLGGLRSLEMSDIANSRRCKTKGKLRRRCAVRCVTVAR